MASFQSAAEAPDYDDEEEHPDVDCGHCGAYLGTRPCDVYVDCEECGGATLSRWAPEPVEPTDEEIACRDAAWAEATLREHAATAEARADAADRDAEGLRRELAVTRAALDDLAAGRDPAQCLVARAGEGTLECRADAPCGACCASARMRAAQGECARLRAHLDDADITFVERGRQLSVALSDADYWREQMTAAAPCVDAVRALGTRLIPGGTGCVVDPVRVVDAVNAALAVIAGREGAPSPDDVASHALAHPVAVRRSANGWEPECAYGLWLARYDTDRRPVLRVDVLALGEDGHWSQDYGACGPPSIVWALPLDATGTPCPWPRVTP